MRKVYLFLAALLAALIAVAVSPYTPGSLMFLLGGLYGFCLLRFFDK